MKLTYLSLDGERITENFKDRESVRRSKLHQRALDILVEEIPLARVIEEVPIRLYSKRQPVFFDIYVPINRWFIEIQGQQHYSYSSFFHKNKRSFLKAVQRDRDKEDWCELNEYRLIQLKYDEISKWTQTIISNK